VDVLRTYLLEFTASHSHEAINHQISSDFRHFLFLYIANKVITQTFVIEELSQICFHNLHNRKASLDYGSVNKKKLVLVSIAGKPKDSTNQYPRKLNNCFYIGEPHPTPPHHIYLHICNVNTKMMTKIRWFSRIKVGGGGGGGGGC
jgi:hypothetical protein